MSTLAAATSGRLELETSELVSADGVLADLTPAALYSEGKGWEHATIQCESLEVAHFRSERVQAGTIAAPVATEERSYLLTNVNASITNQQANAWLGLYPHTNRATLAAQTDFLIEAASGQAIGNGLSTPEAEPTPDRPAYAFGTNDAAILVNTTSNLSLNGDLVLKLSGVVLAMDAEQNDSELDTRVAPATATTNERNWAFLQCANGRLSTVEPVALLILTPRVDFERVETLRTRAQTGVLTANGEERDASGEILIRGTLSGSAAAHAATTRLEVEGDILATSIPITPSPWRWIPWLSIGGIGLVAVGAIATHLRRRDRLNVEQYVQLATAAGEEGRHHEAVEWLDHAIKQAGRHPRLLTDRGFYLSQAGDVPGALRDYDEALHGGGAEAGMLCARLLVEVVGDNEGAAKAVIRALDLVPALVLEVSDDRVLEPLLRRPDVRRAMEQADRLVE